MRLPVALAVGVAMLATTAAYAADDPSIKGQMRTEIQSAMMTHINSNLLEGRYIVFDDADRRVKRLAYERLHKGIVRKGKFFVSCAAFSNFDGTPYDLDFLVAKSGDDYRVLQTVVHKVGDDERAYSVE